MRTPTITGNWKMNLDRRSALDLVGALREHLAAKGPGDAVEVGVAPPFVYLGEVVAALAGSPVRVGAQNACEHASGAFTGEVSVSMLADVGCDFVILGHSERRHVYGEGDETVNRKVHLALEAGLEVILCVGETLEERDGGRTEDVVRRQLTEGLAGVEREALPRITLAYEPVWAIGTGRNATPEQAGEVPQYARGLLGGLYDEALADGIRIQYGGSVKPKNARELLAVEGVDGCLVGGASLKPDLFIPIIDAPTLGADAR